MHEIDGNIWIKALQSGCNSILNHRDRIDGMNVFPVPDGDTGSNMSATMEYATKDTLKKIVNNSIGAIASLFAKGMLLGARGNSGVILSQIFKGISVGLHNKNKAKAIDIVAAFGEAQKYAYKSIMKPVEGTILTVVKMIYKKLSQSITLSNSINDVFAQATKFAREACEETPNFLPILKEVGVTDSGGEGLYVILEGISSFLRGNPVVLLKKPNTKLVNDFIMNSEEDFSGKYGYCTELILKLQNPKNFQKNKMELALNRMGKSLIVIHDEDILKIHIHTLKPGNIFNFVQKYGEFLKIKSENMNLQVNESNAAKRSGLLKQPAYLPKVGQDQKRELKIAVISCNSGVGIINEMQNLGVNYVIDAGQSNNPAASIFVEAINSLNTNKIILLPNNSNIIMVAQQVAATAQKEIIVIPTKTQMQGIVAMMNFDQNLKIHENQENMEDAIGEVQTGQVTQAIKTTKVNGITVKKGNYLAIANGKIIDSTSSKTRAAKHICDKFINDNIEIVTIYYGDDSTYADAEDISSHIENNYDVEVEIKEGKQPIYNFLIAFE